MSSGLLSTGGMIARARHHVAARLPRDAQRFVLSSSELEAMEREDEARAERVMWQHYWTSATRDQVAPDDTPV